MSWAAFKKKYEDELLNSIIPFWQKNSIDSEYGGYFTLLDRDGSVFDTTKYIWMQWRIVYQFATLYMTPYRQNEWLKIAEQGYDFLTTHGYSENQNFYFALNQKGNPLIAPYNIYSEAFAVMGAAALYKATSQDKYKKTAELAMQNYIDRLSNPKGKWSKMMPAQPIKHYMDHALITANLGNIMRECFETPKFDHLIEDAMDMVINRFWNKECHVLMENLNQDFSIDLDSSLGRQICVGSGLEGCVFLLEYAEIKGDQIVIEKLCKIILTELEFGWDSQYGGLFYFQDLLQKPHLELQWDMKLWWVHTEALTASLLAYRLTKQEKFLEWFKRIDAWIWGHFVDRNYGEWFGYLNRRGEPTHYLKGGKWKTFFHIPRSLLNCIVQFNLLEK
ncbi:Cellobiose 2-epimerase [Candidatus Lokiarchaeum ossiferum]|uniref:Cellobiose 2-epimerase n=1 Tax=Candidatus Lokiarchaeum ossiferum TaxID=2951803 RepID=A0ABY6HKE3_9ARCH|nr:Cellobiose 2-epimerase [Candidatus Lokiarchaeum sp. B-35]